MHPCDSSVDRAFVSVDAVVDVGFAFHRRIKRLPCVSGSCFISIPGAGEYVFDPVAVFWVWDVAEKSDSAGRRVVPSGAIQWHVPVAGLCQFQSGLRQEIRTVQFLFCLLAFRDVLGQGSAILGLTLGIPDQREPSVRNDDATVAANEALLPFVPVAPSLEEVRISPRARSALIRMNNLVPLL